MLWFIGWRAAISAEGVDVRTIQRSGATYDVIAVDLSTSGTSKARIDLYGQRPPLPRTLDAVQTAVAAEGRTLLAAMNAGMYEPNYRSVGLHVERGDERHPLTIGGSGNFGMLPNGVFAVVDGAAVVMDSTRWTSHGMVWLATQSGPALVLDSVLHPNFRQDSTSLHVRNGVGVRPDGVVVFVKSRDPVRFWDLAMLFRDDLGCPNALYLDGAVSALWTSERPIDAAAFGRFSGILAVSVPAQ